jgi:hypothetical protein
LKIELETFTNEMEIYHRHEALYIEDWAGERFHWMNYEYLSSLIFVAYSHWFCFWAIGIVLCDKVTFCYHCHYCVEDLPSFANMCYCASKKKVLLCTWKWHVYLEGADSQCLTWAGSFWAQQYCFLYG